MYHAPGEQYSDAKHWLVVLQGWEVVTHSEVNGSQICPAEHAFTPSFTQETPVGVEQLGGLTGGQNSVAAQGDCDVDAVITFVVDVIAGA